MNSAIRLAREGFVSVQLHRSSPDDASGEFHAGFVGCKGYYTHAIPRTLAVKAFGSEFPAHNMAPVSDEVFREIAACPYLDQVTAAADGLARRALGLA